MGDWLVLVSTPVSVPAWSLFAAFFVGQLTIPLFQRLRRRKQPKQQPKGQPQRPPQNGKPHKAN